MSLSHKITVCQEERGGNYVTLRLNTGHKIRVWFHGGTVNERIKYRLDIDIEGRTYLDVVKVEQSRVK